MATAAERRAYARKLREISRSLDQLERATLQQSIRLLRDVRDRIAGQITGTDFSQFRVAEQQQALDDIIANYESQVRALANGSSRQAFALGERSVIEPLQAANVGVAYFRPSEAQVNILAQFSADLVGGVADDMRRKINSTIRMNALGGQSSLDAMRDITQVLFKSNRPISEKAKLTKGIAYEAERILRTETNRTYQLAAFSQQEQLAKDIPGLQKQWIATADSRTRLTHLNAHGQIVDVDKPFSVNGAKMMYPLDPAGGPSETINCRCDSITVIPEIGPVETPLDEKIEAEKARREGEKAEKVKILKEEDTGERKFELQKQWVDSLSISEKEAIQHWGIRGKDIRAYQAGYYDEYLKSLSDRERRIAQKNIESNVKNWDSALEKGVRYQGQIVRGLSEVPENVVLEWLEAGEISLANDQSASTKIENIQRFVSNRETVIWHVKQDSGIHLFEQTSVTYGGRPVSENEVVMRKGTKYRIIKHEYIVDKSYKNKPIFAKGDNWIFDSEVYFEGTDYSWPDNPMPGVNILRAVRGQLHLYMEEIQ